jgi:hypothetical protein
VIALVWACDQPVGTTVGSLGGTRDAHQCPATSRAAKTVEVLRTVAPRDGWQTLADGSHRCPFHAGATT